MEPVWPAHRHDRRPADRQRPARRGGPRCAPRTSRVRADLVEPPGPFARNRSPRRHGDSELEIREDLREWDYGAYEGLSTPQIRERRAGWWLWRDGCPGGETAAGVGERADRVVADLRETDGDALVFAHGHILRVLAARWVGLGPECGARLGLETATLCSLGWEREVAVIWMWNAP